MGDNTITVAGNAERRVAPEVATWDVAVEATDDEPRAATRSTRERLRP